MNDSFKKFVSIGIAPRGVIAIGFVLMGFIAEGGVLMRIITVCAFRMVFIREVSGLVKKLDVANRSGNALVSDIQFDQLENRLKTIDHQNSYFQQKMKLVSLDNYCFSECWSKSAIGETIIVQPKFDGCTWTRLKRPME